MAIGLPSRPAISVRGQWSDRPRPGANRRYELYPGCRTTGAMLIDGRGTLKPTQGVNLLLDATAVSFTHPGKKQAEDCAAGRFG